MVSLSRIQAVVWRHLMVQHRDLNRIFEIFLWPFFDLLTWGFIGSWIARDALLTTTGYIPLYGMCFWQLFFQAHLSIAASILDEVMSKNLSNLLGSPLRSIEWIGALMCLGMLRIAIVFVLCCVIAWLFFSTTVLYFGWYLLPIILLITMSGWTTGALCAALIVRWGNRVAPFLWATWILASLSGVFTPLYALPSAIQVIGRCLPTSYPYLIAHAYLASGSVPQMLILQGFVINVLYCCGSLLVFAWSFKQTKNYGVARLEAE
ncbi:MAG TPA: ABC transporter permease [Candidatus Limnocylindria bacterium]|nr:ABC transporter permease [Candidatus Limnocylindria bacterium]